MAVTQNLLQALVYYQSVCICYVKPDLNGELRTAHAF